MKKLIYILVVIPFWTFSQSYTVQYDVTLNTISRKGELILNDKTTSFYSEVLSKELSDDKKTEEDGVYNQKVYLGNGKDKAWFQIYKKEKDTLLNINYLEDEKVLCAEVFPKMTWRLEKETKLISGYLCNKATVDFRGRTYIAWFTTDIPVNIGPWKFNGLPGIILQIYDDSAAFSWAVSKVIKNDTDISLPINPDLKRMSFRQFVEEKERLNKERTSQMLLKYVGRGATVVERKYNRAAETKFEWEE